MDATHSRRDFIKLSCVGAGAAALATPITAGAEQPESAGSAAAMPRRPLGKTGWLVSIVGFGAGSRYLAQADLEIAEKMIHRSVELGVNYFDTAFGYQAKGERESYRRFAKYLVPKHRSSVRIASKLGDRDAETAKRNFEITLKELGTDYVDVLHFHALSGKEDVDKLVAADGALKVYRQWKDQGLIKAIGISGHTSGEIMIDGITRLEPDCVMCPMNPAHSGANGGHDFEKVVPFALERGLGVIAMKTTARNRLVGQNGVQAEQLVRYALNLPVAAAVIGMPSLEVVESCASIARTLQPISESERKNLQQKLAHTATNGTLPYLAAGYTDGPTWLA
jgi:uncharacterized protein